MHALVALSVQPKNGPEIHLGPGHPAVQMFWAALAKRKGHLMSAVPIAVVPTAADRMGILVVLKNHAATAATATRSYAVTGWGWLSRTLHLPAIGRWIAGAAGFVKAKVSGVATLLGTSGVVGAATLLISTQSGRSVINTVAIKPMRYIARTFGNLYASTEDTIANPSKVGGIRNAVADGMGTVRVKAAQYKNSIVDSAITKSIVHAVRVDGPLMGLTRAVGAIAFAWGVAGAVTTAPVWGSIILGALAGIALGKFVIAPMWNSAPVQAARYVVGRAMNEAARATNEDLVEIILDAEGEVVSDLVDEATAVNNPDIVDAEVVVVAPETPEVVVENPLSALDQSSLVMASMIAEREVVVYYQGSFTVRALDRAAGKLKATREVHEVHTAPEYRRISLFLNLDTNAEQIDAFAAKIAKETAGVVCVQTYAGKAYDSSGNLFDGEPAAV